MEQLGGFDLDTSYEFLKENLGGIGALAMREMLAKDDERQNILDESS